jgi:PAS domain S-box-containing protein/putative nucleotidyltransferase with HDIG domain
MPRKRRLTLRAKKLKSGPDKRKPLLSKIARLENSEKKLKTAISGLKKTEEVYKKLTMASKEAITITDLDAVITYVSERTVEVHGGSDPSEFIGRDLIELIAPEDRIKALEYFKRAVSEGFLSNVEYKFLKMNGKRFTGEISATVIKSPHGKPVALIYAVRDLTKVKYTENALKITEDKYRALLSNANDAIVLHPVDVFEAGGSGKFIEVNDMACRMFGYDRNDLLNMTPGDLQAKDCRDAAGRASEELAEKGHAIFETCIIRAGGERITCEVSSQVLKIDGVDVAISIIRDITQRKKAEEELKESEEMYRSLVDLSPDAVLIADMQGKIVYASNRALEMNGAPGMEFFIGRKITDIVAPEERDKAVAALAEVYKKAPVHGIEMKLVRYDGRVITGEASAAVIRSGDGREKGVMITVRDITEKKKVDEELKQSYTAVKKIMDGIINAMEKLVEKKDMYTVGHQHRTAQLAKAIAVDMGLPREQVNCIFISALIHDIGKIFVSGSILNKNGPLTKEEYDIIKKHPEAGYEVLKTIDFPWPIADIILQHHERLDGSGYPYGLKEDKIYLESRIISVADVVEAITFARPYRPAFGVDKALEEVVNNKGTLFDTEVVDICQSLLKEKGFEFEKV